VTTATVVNTNTSLLLLLGKTNTVKIVYTDNGSHPNSYTNSWQFAVAPLILTAAFSGGNVELTYPPWAGGFVLQTTTNLVSAQWTVVTNSPAVTASTIVVTLPVSGGDRFFRLKN
jgi:transposase-like protein